MAVTIAVVIKNVCLSRCRKAELAIFRTDIQTSANFTHLVAQKPDQEPFTQSVQNLLEEEPDFKMPLQPNPTSKQFV
jgi:hypothetical protein